MQDKVAIGRAMRNMTSKGFIDLKVEEGIDLGEEIRRLKKEKNAVILAHYYQIPEIQDLCDHLGDSLALSRKAAKTNADIILFAGVHFMAETAKILNPGKKVLLPDLRAGCSLNDSCPPEDFREFISQHPDHFVISYINCSAEVKALSDVVCTSSNAEEIVNSVPGNKPIIFAPDKNLGRYLVNKTGRDMLLWDGSCLVHEAFAIDKLLSLCKSHPNAKIVAHPESEEPILRIAHYIGSTAGMIDYVINDPNHEFIVATEAGILYEMSKRVPHKALIPAPSVEDNTCSCSECGFMKLNTLQKLYLCLKYEMPEVTIADEIQKRALLPIQRMLEISRN